MCPKSEPFLRRMAGPRNSVPPFYCLTHGSAFHPGRAAWKVEGAALVGLSLSTTWLNLGEGPVRTFARSLLRCRAYPSTKGARIRTARYHSGCAQCFCDPFSRNGCGKKSRAERPEQPRRGCAPSRKFMRSSADYTFSPVI